MSKAVAEMYTLSCLLFSYDCFFCSWESLGSPHKLAWYWLQVLEKWTKVQVKPLGGGGVLVSCICYQNQYV